MQTPKRPLVWHQGLFLQPQHFQQFDDYFQSLTGPFFQYLLPCFWGVQDLSVQETALSIRMFEITRGEWVFPDGTWIGFPGNARISPRSFQDLSFDTEGNEKRDVFIGLRKWQHSVANTTRASRDTSVNSITTRMVSSLDPDSIPDLHEDGPQADVRFAEYAIRIFWDHEIDSVEDYQFIRIARLVLDGDQVRMSNSFIPPVLSVEASGDLLQLLRAIREQLISRSRVFESFKISQGLQGGDFEAHFLPHLLVLGCMNRSLPVLNHLIENPTIHPFIVYGLLRRIVGEFSSFTDRIDSLGVTKDGTPLLPSYDHENLWGCFSDAHQLISELLSNISVGGENIFHLSRVEETFSVDFPADQFTDLNIYFLVVHTASEEKSVVSSLQKMAKVGTLDELPILVSRALPGIPIRHRLVPPPGMPKLNGVHYFKLDHQHASWQEIRNQGELSMYWDSAPDDVEIDLVISKL